MDLSELLMLCRINGYFNLEDLQTVILEPNGRLSFLPKADTRPLSPKDIKLTPSQEHTFTTLIMEGKVLENNLKSCGKEMQWLKKEIKRQNNSSIENIFFAACDSNDTFICFEKQEDNMKRDKFL